MSPDLTGYILEHKCSWWYITGLPRRLGQSEYYPVVKCTSTGKKFKKTNELSAILILEKQKAGKLKYVGESAKISDAGQQDGIKKRRVQFLEREIAAYTAELNKLNRELGIETRFVVSVVPEQVVDLLAR